MSSRHDIVARSKAPPLFALLGGIMVSAATLAAQVSEQVTVVKTPLTIRVTASSAVIEGRWRISGRRDPNFSLARINSAYILCSHLTNRCEEEIAELRTPGDGQRMGISSGELLATFHDYEVTEWNGDVLVAISRKAAADLVLRINIKKKTAERLFRERADPTKFSSYKLE